MMMMLLLAMMAVMGVAVMPVMMEEMVAMVEMKLKLEKTAVGPLLTFEFVELLGTGAAAEDGEGERVEAAAAAVVMLAVVVMVATTPVILPLLTLMSAVAMVLVLACLVISTEMVTVAEVERVLQIWMASGMSSVVVNAANAVAVAAAAEAAVAPCGEMTAPRVQPSAMKAAWTMPWQAVQDGWIHHPAVASPRKVHGTVLGVKCNSMLTITDIHLNSMDHFINNLATRVRVPIPKSETHY